MVTSESFQLSSYTSNHGIIHYFENDNGLVIGISTTFYDWHHSFELSTVLFSAQKTSSNTYFAKSASIQNKGAGCVIPTNEYRKSCLIVIFPMIKTYQP